MPRDSTTLEDSRSFENHSQTSSSQRESCVRSQPPQDDNEHASSSQPPPPTKRSFLAATVAMIGAVVTQTPKPKQK
jgi:hypothetical protein